MLGRLQQGRSRGVGGQGVASRVGIDGPGGQREGGRPGWKWSEAVRRDQAGNIPGPGPLGVLGPGGALAGSAVMRVLSEAWGKRPTGQRRLTVCKTRPHSFSFRCLCDGLSWPSGCAMRKARKQPGFPRAIGYGVPPSVGPLSELHSCRRLLAAAFGARVGPWGSPEPWAVFLSASPTHQSSIIPSPFVQP